MHAISESFKVRLLGFPDASSENPEDRKWFSKERAKRGAKVGAAFGIGIPLPGVIIYAAGGHAGEMANIKSIVEVGAFTLYNFVAWGGIGAGVNSFKPSAHAMQEAFAPTNRLIQFTTSKIKRNS